MRTRRLAAAVCCAATFAGVFAAGGGALAASTTWTIQKSPNATLAGGQLEAVSCSSPAACTAVGQYLNPSGITVTLAERWDGSAWQKQAVPNPAGDTTPSVSPDLLGVSCPASGFCAAVGDYQEQQYDSASLAETWNGSQWTLRPFPVPAGSDSPELAQVSCTSAKFCEAVGSYTDDSDFSTVPLAAAWNGTSWTLQSTPAQVNSSGLSAGFTAVSCTSPSLCEAWGSGNSNNPAPGVAEQWNGTSWQVQTVPSGAVAVTSMSCTSAAFCEAVGTSAAYNWNGSQWSAQTLPGSMSSAGITGVSCASAKRCEMVGEGNVNGNDIGLAAAWNGSKWSSQSAPNPAKATWVNLNAVSCASATSCEAVGDSQAEVTADDPRALAETWNGSSWALQSAAAPAGATYNALSAVSCVSASFCAAVGTHFNAAGNQVNLAEVWNGTSWVIKPIPDLTSANGGADSDLYSVSCVSASFCQAVGAGPAGADASLWNGSSWTTQVVPGDADVQPQEVSCATADFCMLVNGFGDAYTWNGSAWSAATSVTGFSFAGSVSCLSASFCEVVGAGPSGENATAWNGTSWVAQTTPGPVGNSLNAVSCTAPAACEAAGQTPGSSGYPTPLAESWNGSAWTIQQAPAPANSQSSSLIAVSCTSATSCTAVGQDQSSAVASYGVLQTLAEVWDGAAWTIATTPDSGSTQNQLTGVSCGASSTCTAVGQYDDPGNIPATLVEAGN
jgi:hypothetical protein